MKLQVFVIDRPSIDERQILCSYTNITALRDYCQYKSMDIWEFKDDDDIKRIPEDIWPKLPIIDTDATEPNSTLKKFMDGATIPCLIAQGTEK